MGKFCILYNVGGRFQASQSGGTQRGMPRIPGRSGGGQFAGAGFQAGPAFNTLTAGANQNMNIQFRPLPTNQQGQPGRFDPNSAFNTPFNTGSTQPANQNQINAVNADRSSHGQTFSLTRETLASNTGPAEFQIVRVGNLPEFSRNLGSRVNVRMQGITFVTQNR